MTTELDDILETGEAPSPRQGPEQDAESADAQFDELQRVSNYRLVRKTLRPAGIGSIVFGLIAIATGFGQMHANPINAILGLIGVFLLVEGIWITAAPTPAGMIVDGIALIVLGAWNVFITIANAASGGGGGPNFFAVLGIWQIVWGCQGFGRHARLSKLPMNKPSEQTLKMIDGIVKDITRGKPKDVPDLIEFQIKNQIWKGRLSQDSAILVQAAGQDVVFARKAQFQIDQTGKVLIGKTLKASFRLRDKSQNGTISPENFEKYAAWKNEGQ